MNDRCAETGGIDEHAKMRIGIFQPAQRDGLVDLRIESAQFYDAPGNVTVSGVTGHLDTALTGSGSPITLVTADESDGRVVGLAALIVMPSLVEVVGPGRFQCQLKELYVTERCRGDGVGEALLRWSARFAIDRGCGRMDWNVKVGNAAGIRFYGRHGGELVADRLSYRVRGETLAALARQDLISEDI